MIDRRDFMKTTALERPMGIQQLRGPFRERQVQKRSAKAY